MEMLRENGADVVAHFDDDDGFHAVELFDPHKANYLYDVVGEFIRSCSTTNCNVVVVVAKSTM